MDSSSPEISRVLKLTLEEALLELGEALPEEEWYGVGDRIVRAREWIDAKRGILYEGLCAEDRWPSLRLKLNGKQLDEAFVAAADAWISPLFFGMPLPVFTIARILLYYGMDTLCGC